MSIYHFVKKSFSLLIVTLPFLFYGCTTGFPDYNGKYYDILSSTDKSTLNVIGVGRPRRNESNRTKRKIQSKEAAKLMAQRGALIFLQKNPRYFTKKDLSAMNLENVSVSGVILNEEWDENENCRILYQIRSPQ